MNLSHDWSIKYLNLIDGRAAMMSVNGGSFRVSSEWGIAFVGVEAEQINMQVYLNGPA